MKDLGFTEELNFIESDDYFKNVDLDTPKPAVYRENLDPISLASPTFEAVLQQNEDLMKRLKIALRRLNQLETSNTQHSLEVNKLKLQNQSLMSRYAVHKEEIEEYKTDIKKLEIERDKALEIKNLIEKKNQELLTTSEQFEVYKEKISTEVKPYITELKVENIELKEEIKNLNSIQQTLFTQIEELRSHIIEVTQSYTQEHNFTKTSYETTLSSLNEQLNFIKTELKEKNEANQDLELRLQKSMHRSEHMDQIENSLIQEKRDHESTRAMLGSEIERLQNKFYELHQSYTQLDSENEKLKLESHSIKLKLSEYERENQNAHEQLGALRNLYSKKMQEFEKLEKSYEALERLNLELSRSIGQA